ncbi:MAG: porphobilinogen synthase [Tannerellaceae bacterium]|nr:porphobilinogen synthase [Tannerellaceae bacterium]
MKRSRPYRLTPSGHNSYKVVVTPGDFIYPCTVTTGEQIREEIEGLPGIYRYSVDTSSEEIKACLSLGINRIMLFGGADHPGNLFLADVIRIIQQQHPEVILYTDVCLPAGGEEQLPDLVELAYQYALAGASFVSPSSTLEGQVEAICDRMAAAGLPTQVLAYPAQYDSSFCGLWQGNTAGTDSATVDYCSRSQGLSEIESDMHAGANWIMVKPAMEYLDIIVRARRLFPEIQLVGFQVAGEYAMLKAAARLGYLNEQQSFYESLTAIRRSGTDYIITYYAKEFVMRWQQVQAAVTHSDTSYFLKQNSYEYSTT